MTYLYLSYVLQKSWFVRLQVTAGHRDNPSNSCAVNGALWNHQKLAAKHKELWGISSQIEEVNQHSAAESL